MVGTAATSRRAALTAAPAVLLGGATARGEAAASTSAPEAAASGGEALDIADVQRLLRKSFVEDQYYVGGPFDFRLFQDDCVFTGACPVGPWKRPVSRTSSSWLHSSAREAVLCEHAHAQAAPPPHLRPLTAQSKTHRRLTDASGPRPCSIALPLSALRKLAPRGV